MDTDKKYFLYESSVQNPQGDVEFINEKFEEIRGEHPLSLREDFGGTGLLCCEWVKQGPRHSAAVIDLDPGPMGYGQKRHWKKLPEAARDRIAYHEMNVLDATYIKSDVVVAFNFSYFIFKRRQELLDYCIEVRKSLAEGGVFFLDCFGGPECYSPLEEETEYDDFTYFWDLDRYNPIDNGVLYYIHFKEKGKAKQRAAFTYDWRMWSVAEIRDVLAEAGFRHSVVYWEGDSDDDDDEDGDGEFTACEEAEQCDSWIVYLAAYS